MDTNGYPVEAMGKILGELVDRKRSVKELAQHYQIPEEQIQIWKNELASHILELYETYLERYGSSAEDITPIQDKSEPKHKVQNRIRSKIRSKAKNGAKNKNKD